MATQAFRLTCGVLLVSAWLMPLPTRAEDKDGSNRSIHGRAYTSHRTPGNTAFEGPGSWHGHPRHGFELGAHWDRRYPPNGTPYLGNGVSGTRCAPPLRCGAPWPLSNLDIEVQAE